MVRIVCPQLPVGVLLGDLHRESLRPGPLDGSVPLGSDTAKARSSWPGSVSCVAQLELWAVVGNHSCLRVYILYIYIYIYI